MVVCVRCERARRDVWNRDVEGDGVVSGGPMYRLGQGGRGEGRGGERRGEEGRGEEGRGEAEGGKGGRGREIYLYEKPLRPL